METINGDEVKLLLICVKLAHFLFVEGRRGESLFIQSKYFIIKIKRGYIEHVCQIGRKAGSPSQ